MIDEFFLRVWETFVRWIGGLVLNGVVRAKGFKCGIRALLLARDFFSPRITV